jgi:hypothetical protein
MVPAGFRNQEIKSGKKEKRHIARMEGCLKPSTSSQVTVSPLPAREKLRIREENSLRNREENWGALESWSPGVLESSDLVPRNGFRELRNTPTHVRPLSGQNFWLPTYSQRLISSPLGLRVTGLVHPCLVYGKLRHGGWGLVTVCKVT